MFLPRKPESNGWFVLSLEKNEGWHFSLSPPRMRKLGTTQPEGGRIAHHYAFTWRQGATAAKARKRLRENPSPMEVDPKVTWDDILAFVENFTRSTQRLKNRNGTIT